MKSGKRVEKISKKILASLCLVIGLGLFATNRSVQAAGAASDHTVLILGSTVSGGASSVEATAATAAGYDVEVVDDATWSGKSAADFATYRAIILGDAFCAGVSAITAAEANRATWGPEIDGNVIVVGTDPVFHNGQGGNAVSTGAVKFAADIPGKTGAYICLSCYYHGTVAMTPVPVLEPFGSFTATGVGCFNDAHKVADHVALTGITDTTLSNWSCSVHEAFDSFPTSFLPLAIAENITGPGSLTFADGTFGIPYILARGEDLVPEACGDGTVQAPEECDDGNTANGDGCSAQCKSEGGVGACGDGTVNSATEECDDGNTESNDGCSATCVEEICGDEIKQDGIGEECDDGNDEDFDGCSSECLVESECDIACHKPEAMHVDAANHALIGSKGNDILCGDERDNEIRGQKGDDLLCGFGGDDFLQGGSGVDRVFGGEGNDILDAGKGGDFLYGEEGNDHLFGGKGHDWLDGGPGNDQLRDDKKGDDTLLGGDGDDSLFGGKGRDRLEGGKGIDALFGGKGADWLDGGEGEDFADGGKGPDTCINAETTVRCP
ncbi:MAG: DUF4215 domain-containing protein [Deltaproteobacteria bacterium]|nr:DUF4215 domain-containing protein [Deltaproteobacteria bacterium]